MSESNLSALIVAPPAATEIVVTGLPLGERARRVARGAGVDDHHIHIVRDPDELAAAAELVAGAPLLFIRATDQLVAAPLIEPLDLDASGTRKAEHGGEYAGALRLEPDAGERLLAALDADPSGGDQAIADSVADAVAVSRRARHPVRTPDEVTAADAWQFELVDKPLDSFLARRLYRPLARPFTRMFLRLPLSPNAISVLSTALSLAGCVVAAYPSAWAHACGLALLMFGGVIDCCDGEVARLRLEGSLLGAWLDAIGDDLARLALIAAVGVHLAPAYPELPMVWLAVLAVGLTLTSMVLIYWYCIVVIGSYLNQDYEAAIGIGTGRDGDSRTWLHKLGDLGAQAARRDFFDPAALVLALLGLPEVTFAGLALGSAIGLAVILPTHLRIVRERKLEAQQAAES